MIMVTGNSGGLLTFQELQGAAAGAAGAANGMQDGRTTHLQANAKSLKVSKNNHNGNFAGIKLDPNFPISLTIDPI